MGIPAPHLPMFEDRVWRNGLLTLPSLSMKEAELQERIN